MRIVINYLTNNYDWQHLVDQSSLDAAKVLSDPNFIAKVRSWPSFDFTDETPGQIADKLAALGDVKIDVGFYYKRWFTKAIAYEENEAVYFNTAKRAYGAGSPGNVAHETMHAIGYEHNGNAAAGNENTVPYRIGQWVDEWLDAQS